MKISLGGVIHYTILEVSHNQRLRHDLHARRPSVDLQSEAVVQKPLHAAICCLAC